MKLEVAWYVLKEGCAATVVQPQDPPGMLLVAFEHMHALLSHAEIFKLYKKPHKDLDVILKQKGLKYGGTLVWREWEFALTYVKFSAGTEDVKNPGTGPSNPTTARNHRRFSVALCVFK